MTTFTCITTCKDRLDHLAQTLPAMLAAGFDEVIVVDFDCPQSTAEWCKANYPEVKVVKVSHRPHFNASEARNIGADKALSKWLCFVDADLKVSKNLVHWLRANVRKHSFYGIDHAQFKKRKDIRNATGLLVCEHTAFKAAGQYDEVYIDWGYEDIDIQLKLRHAGFIGRPLPVSAVASSITHDDEVRTRHHRNKNKKVSHLKNKLYGAAKIKLATAFGLSTDLPRSIREELYREVTGLSRKWDPDHVSLIHSVDLDVPKGVKALIDKKKSSASLKELVSHKLAVQVAYERKLRKDVFSRLPSFLRKLRSGLR